MRAASLLRGAKSVVVFTGAGISAESGLPTFRSGANAMWNTADVARYAAPHGYRAHAKIVNLEVAGQMPQGERVMHVQGSSGEVLPLVTDLTWPDR